MKNVNLIMAVHNSADYPIGAQGKLPWSSEGEGAKADMARFKALTTGSIVVMGRKTYESLGMTKPLPDRTNVIISRSGKDCSDTHPDGDGPFTYNSIEDFLDSSIATDVEYGRQIFVIGGRELATAFMPHVDKIYLTLIYEPLTRNPDVFFPELVNDTLLIGAGTTWTVNDTQEIPNTDGEPLVMFYEMTRLQR